jgi:ADP-ribose pyrophosphatase
MIRRVSRERLFEGPVFDVVRENGRDVVVHGPAVAIVAVDCSDRIVLVRQERAGSGTPLLELPAGTIDEGEVPLAAAHRELREETGLHGGEWSELRSFFTTPGFCDERMHVFLATGLEEGEPEPEDGEELEIVRVSRDSLSALLPDLDDAKTIVGLLLLLHG